MVTVTISAEGFDGGMEAAPGAGGEPDDKGALDVKGGCELISDHTPRRSC